MKALPARDLSLVAWSCSARLGANADSGCHRIGHSQPGHDGLVSAPWRVCCCAALVAILWMGFNEKDAFWYGKEQGPEAQ